MQCEIEKEEKRLQLRRECIPDLEAEEAKLREWAARHIDLAHTVARKNAIRDADALAQTVLAIRSGRAERSFRRKVKPFVRANKKMLFDKQIAPAGRKRKRSVCSWLGSSSSQDAKQLTKTDMLAEYLTLFEGSVGMPSIETNDCCPLCSQKLIVVDRKAQATCTKCGFCQQHMDATTASVQYNSDYEFSQFSYKRVNHFNDWLSQIQARESGDIGDDVMRLVMQQLYSRRIRHCSQITVPIVRDILKSLKLRRAYDHVTQITCRLTGEPPPRLHPHLEECCRIMFIQIQPSFEKHKGKRKNMLSYSYTLFKFLQLLGVENIPLLHFSLLKGRDKLERQDEIFKKICQDLDWEFVPSI